MYFRILIQDVRGRIVETKVYDTQEDAEAYLATLVPSGFYAFFRLERTDVLWRGEIGAEEEVPE